MKRSALALLMLLAFAGRSQAAPVVVEQGKTVKFDYTLTVNGQEVDTSKGKQPLEYVQGQNMIIPGLEKQMAGLKVGDERTVIVPAAEAYGIVDPRAVIEAPKSEFGMDPKKGMQVQIQTASGQPLQGVITEVKSETIMVDFNHPLAGQDLTFAIKVVDIK